MAGFPTFLFAPFARKNAPVGDYLHRLIAVSIRRERRNFFLSFKDAAGSEIDRKRIVKSKAESEKELERRKKFSYPIVDHTMEPVILLR